MLPWAIAFLAVSLVIDPKPNPDRFLDLVWHVDESSDNIYRYRFFVPPAASAANRMPLIVWLHGYGERGEDNVKMLRWTPLLFEEAADNPSFFLLVVQHHFDEEDWRYPAPGRSTDALSMVYEIAQHVIAEYPIDPDRVYVIGISSGGSAAFELASRHPETFAALAPISSTGGDPSRAWALTKIPTWAFNCSIDTAAPPKVTLPTIAAIQAAGGIAELTTTAEVKGAMPHDSWNEAFRKYHVLDWILAQRRGQPGPPPGGTSLSKAIAWLKANGWVAAVWLVILTAVFFLVRRSRRGIPAASADPASPTADQVPSGAP